MTVPRRVRVRHGKRFRPKVGVDMKANFRGCVSAGCFVLLWLSLPVLAADPVVTSFSGGYLSWTNPPNGLQMYSVEWTHDLIAGSWKSDWNDQGAVMTTQSTISVPVPTSYRVARGFDNRAPGGAWLIYSPDDIAIMRLDGQGQIQMFSAFTPAHPAGYYHVNSNGLMDAYVYDSDEVIHFSAVIISPTILQYSYMGSTGQMHKVVNPAALQGTWRGSIGPYTNVIIPVRGDGYAPGISNLIGVASGVMYMDISNAVAGAIWTGADCNDGWNSLEIRGVMLNPTNIFGDYMLDSDSGWITAGVNLKKP